MKARLFIISALTIIVWACGGSDSAVSLDGGPGLDKIAYLDGLQADVSLDSVPPADAQTPAEVGELKAGCEPETCQVENEYGTCRGWRYCDMNQILLPCNAAQASAERCDGEDNDCDGLVDEDAACDDGNTCTLDQCVEGECRNQGLDGDTCDDEDPCTLNDLCRAGTCMGQVVDCDDQDLCTDDWCGDGECRHTPNQTLCDDNDPCTLGDHCLDKLCRGTPVDCECLADEDCAVLEDGNLCNGTLVCDQSAMPARCIVAADSVVDCPEPEGTNAACLQTICNPETGECGFEAAAEGQACVNQDLCTIGDFCQDGECVDGPAANCRDDNPCTDDSCDPATGCLNQANSLPCQDGSACTIGDTCMDGACVPGHTLSCDDQNPCTADTCDPVQGCQHEAAAADCDDQNLCTAGDYCQSGQCLPGQSIDCDDDNPCTTDTCHPSTGCTHVDNNNPCDDSNPYTINDICQDRVCAGELIDCDDSNPCTDDEPDDQLGCLHTPNQDPCDDQNLCTLGDQCTSGICVAADTEVCDDEDPCTDDYCDPAVGCRHSFNTRPCDDLNACTNQDTCSLGQCLGIAEVCDDANPCTDDGCDPASGCVFTPNDDPCDDRNDCTTGDTCSGGICLGNGSADCDDANPCTRDICLFTGSCEHQSLTNLACSDGDPCTTNDLCEDGQCVSGAPRACDDGSPCTDDHCDSSGTCIHIANHADCDDDNLCTLGETCSGGICTPESLLDCDDGDVCTADSCDPALGCLHQANTLPCNDGDLCTTGDLCLDGQCRGSALLCDDGNLCTDDSCDPGQGCIYQSNQLGCDDGDPCTINDTCRDGWCKGTVSLVCGDGNICGPETCEDGNDDPCDGCADCRLHTNTCGDRYVCDLETCDDGNSFSWDGCRDCSICEYIGTDNDTCVYWNPYIIPSADDGFLLLFGGLIYPGNHENKIWGRLFDSGGLPETEVFKINTTEVRGRTRVRGARLADDTFIIVWQNMSDWVYSSPAYIFGQFLTSEGSLQGSEFIITSIMNSPQSLPVVKVQSEGSFIVAWTICSSQSDCDVMAQRFSSDGTRQGEEFMVNSTTDGIQTAAELAIFSDDSYIITWTSKTQAGSNKEIHAQHFHAEGTHIGEEFVISNHAADYWLNYAVAVLPDDSFVVVWDSPIDDTYSNTHLQRFNYNKTPIYDELVVNHETLGSYNPTVAVTESGLLFVAWEHYEYNDNFLGGTQIHARLVGTDGALIGDVFSVSHGGFENSGAEVTSLTNGNVAVTWWDYGRPECSIEDVFIMRYDAGLNPLYH